MQIAGLVARRIVCFVSEGDELCGRRADRPDPLRLAARRLSAARQRTVLVAEGQTAIAGETVLARFGAGRRDRRSGSTDATMAIFPPFDPDEPPPRQRSAQLAADPGPPVLPNLVTLLALCAGLTSIRMSIEQRYEWAIAAIAIAAASRRHRRAGGALPQARPRASAPSSIRSTDFVNFGVAPGILLYVWALDEVRSLGWIAVLVFAICAALRLARFNVALDEPDEARLAGELSSSACRRRPAR